jgi:hypothetical protein
MQDRSIVRFVGIALRLERFTSAGKNSIKAEETRNSNLLATVKHSPQVIPVLPSRLGSELRTTRVVIAISASF